MNDFSGRFKEALEHKNMRPAELSRRTGIGKSSISMYLSGKNEPRGNHLHLIAKTLDVSESWLLGYDERNLSVNKQSHYEVAICIDEVSVKVYLYAVSEDEAIGVTMKHITEATYKNIIYVKEDT